MTARGLSEISDISRTKCYSALEKLEELGFVKEYPPEPIVYPEKYELWGSNRQRRWRVENNKNYSPKFWLIINLNVNGEMDH